MAQPQDVIALLEGPKDRRVECAITAAMDAAIEEFQARYESTRSQAIRMMLARGASTEPGLIARAVRATRERDAGEQGRNGE